MFEDSASKTFTETVGDETILLVEDEEIIRLMLVEILRHQGYTVLEAGLGKDALALAAGHEHPIHLLVTDMTMPGMNGWDMAKTLRTTRPGIPILFTSGHSDHETSLWGKMDPPVEHLFKPFSMESFLRKARQMLDNYKLPASSSGSPAPVAAAPPPDRK
jgi:CheY-like chemotaxis protein